MSTDYQDGIVFATGNQGKLTEARSLLFGLPVALRDLADFASLAEPDETGESFLENSQLKASYYAKGTGHWTIADDSGLEVKCLDDRPGVLSARFGGPNIDYAARISLLLEAIAATGSRDRRARFICSISFAAPDGSIVASFSGTCNGRIVMEARGSNGFGYDPVFAPDGYEQTFGELPAGVKERLSHRARALALFRAYLLNSLAGLA